MRVWQHSSVYRAFGLLVVAGALTLLVAQFSKPLAKSGALPDLARAIPARFDNWVEHELSSVVLPAEMNEEDGTATLYRAYTNEEGALITLVIAYGAARGDTVRLHQPQVCYKAQGYEVLSHRSVMTSGIAAAQMVAARNLGEERVTYWMRTGDKVTTNQASQQWANMRAGLGRAADSTLVRVSTNSVRTDQAWQVQQDFIADMLGAVSEETRSLLTAQQGEEA